MLPLVAGFLAFIIAFIPDTPVNRFFGYVMNMILPNKRPEPSQLIEMYHRGIITEKQLKEGLIIHGYGGDFAEWIIKATTRLNTAEELLLAKWRGVISEDEYLQGMKALGFVTEDGKPDTEKIKLFEQVRRYYPNPGDLIRFGVRDVFRPEIVKKYGYDEDFPEDITPWLQKVGMDEEIMKLYWRAHWELPSPTQVYEMFLRLNPDVLAVVGDKYKDMGLNPEEISTDIDTVKEYLRVADYPKYWRDRMLALAYPPITRVDLRRIYALGLIGDEELVARLMELGYTRKDAELLAEFYKRYKHESGYDLTRTQILEGYKRRLISAEEAKKLLQEIGYDEDEAEFVLALEEAKLQDDILEQKIAIARHKYVKGLITLDELEKELEELNLPLTKIEFELGKAVKERERSIKLPAKSDLLKWLRNGIIAETEFRELMLQLGYSEKYIDYYIKEVKAGGG